MQETNMPESTADQYSVCTLVKIIGSPFDNQQEVWHPSSDYDLEKLYNLAFENRVELLYLQALEQSGLITDMLEDQKRQMEHRATTTRQVAADASHVLRETGVRHAVFKSLKPYPATPNDTDIVCLGNETMYQCGLQALGDAEYVVLNHAPMQTLLAHKWGRGKVDSKKKGGTYYLDFYRGIAVDYYEYINKQALETYLVEQDVEGVQTVLLAAEPELAIVMFHNVFPEKTFHLEHFYLCLYGMFSPDFDVDLFIRFAEENALTRAVRSNLTVIEMLHQKVFDFVPGVVEMLLGRWGRDQSVREAYERNQYHMTFIFPASTFWKVFMSKLADPFSRRSLRRQCVHMLHPVFFWDALEAAWRRTFGGKEIYQHQ